MHDSVLLSITVSCARESPRESLAWHQESVKASAIVKLLQMHVDVTLHVNKRQREQAVLIACLPLHMPNEQTHDNLQIYIDTLSEINRNQTLHASMLTMLYACPQDPEVPEHVQPSRLLLIHDDPTPTATKPLHAKTHSHVSQNRCV